MPRKSANAPLLTVLYDGERALWRTRIGIYKLEARRLGIDIAWRDVARKPDALESLGLDPRARRSSLYALDGDGIVYAGADALALLWSVLPSHRRLGHALATPAAATLARLCGKLSRFASPRRGAPPEAPAH